MARPLASGVLPTTAVSTAVRLGFLLLVLLLVMIVGILVGPVPLSPSEVIQIVLYKLGLYAGHVTWSAGDQDIVWALRLPRVVAAAVVGAALGVAGALFQAVLRNPLADPYVIGTAAGAQLGVVVALLLPTQFLLFGFGPLQLLAFIGALSTVLFVYWIARTGGTTPIVTLLLAGFVVSSFLISGTTALAYTGGRLQDVVGWTMGGLEVSEWSQLSAAVPISCVAIALAVMLARPLDLLLLGEEAAAHLGVRVEAVKLAAIVVASLLTAVSVTLAGVVAFVGLIIPHGVRLVYGAHHRLLIPASAVAGGAFLVVADLIARTAVAPTTLPLGVVTAVIGSPLFLHLLRRSRKRYVL